MSRAAGRKNLPRAPLPDDFNPEENYTGESERQKPGPRPYNSPIPGGATGGPHLANHPTVRQSVPVPESKPEHRGIMAHGVPLGKEEFTDRQHAVHMRGEDTENLGPNAPAPPKPHYKQPPQKPTPVPVYMVDSPGQGSRPLHTMAGDHFTVPAKTADPIRIAGRDLNRSEIMLLVETPAGSSGAAPQGVRIDHEVGNLTAGGGILIPAGTGSYQRFHMCDELFAVSTDASACTLSVAYLYGVAGAG